MNDLDPEPCRHCGKETIQRADGKPYCSMDCISARRREQKEETIQCSYPGCYWEVRYLPDNNFSKMKAHHEVDEHRREHLSDFGS